MDEHWQAGCLQTDQASPNMPCVDWPAEEAEHASAKHARERCRHTPSYSDQSGTPGIGPMIYGSNFFCISSLLELRFLTMRVILCFPFTYAARLGKPDRGSTTKAAGGVLTSNNYVAKEKTAIFCGDKPSHVQLPRGVNKYLNRWKPRNSRLFFLLLVCVPNTVGGAQPERDLSETNTSWGTNSPQGQSSVPFHNSLMKNCLCATVLPTP